MNSARTFENRVSLDVDNTYVAEEILRSGFQRSPSTYMDIWMTTSVRRYQYTLYSERTSQPQRNPRSQPRCTANGRAPGDQERPLARLVFHSSATFIHKYRKLTRGTCFGITDDKIYLRNIDYEITNMRGNETMEPGLSLAGCGVPIGSLRDWFLQEHNLGPKCQQHFTKTILTA